MRRWIHRSAVTALAAMGLVAASSGLATAQPHNLDTAAAEPSGSSAGQGGAHNELDAEDKPSMGLPSKLDPQQISPHLQPRSLDSPSAAEASATIGKRWAGPGQVHPFHIDT